MVFYHFVTVYKDVIEATGREDGIWTNNAALTVSNVSFTLIEYIVKNGLTLVRNITYWNAANVSLSTIDGAFNDTENSANAAYNMVNLTLYLLSQFSKFLHLSLVLMNLMHFHYLEIIITVSI